MSNKATVRRSQLDPSTYEILVNGSLITGRTESEANTISQRLNNIFSDTKRDLDFITPSYVNGQYVVCCPRVRRDNNEITYLYDTSNGSSGWRNFPAKLYEPTNWVNTNNSSQTAILTIPTTATKPWLDAINIANRIRAAVVPSYNDAANRTMRQLIIPTNQGTTTALISSSAHCAFYGHPCQGTRGGTTSPDCGYGDLNAYQNILNTVSHNNEVLHPCDLTAAMTSTNSWNTTYRNKWIRVTNRSNNSSIVVKVTDTAPANKGVELTYAAWVAIGKPSGNNSVSIHLMGN